jgi:hypothetical protein
LARKKHLILGNGRRLSAWILRSALLLLAAALTRTTACADSFTYASIIFGITGDIVASWHNCPLNSSDVIAWALSGAGDSDRINRERRDVCGERG